MWFYNSNNNSLKSDMASKSASIIIFKRFYLKLVLLNIPLVFNIIIASASCM